MFERKARNYPRTSDIRRLVQATRESGVLVRAVEIRADGTIRLMPNAELRSADEEAKDEVDAWEKAGRL
ncbi:MAG: hypothetical protein ACOY4C_12965 [Pseudomonadota bacterium]